VNHEGETEAYKKKKCMFEKQKLGVSIVFAVG
jgi:hypothetical protein